MSISVADLCRQHSVSFEQLVDRSGLEETRVTAILLGRWTPSPGERASIAAVFGVDIAEISWGHVTPIQHIYGSGPS